MGVRLWVPFVIGAFVSIGIVALLVYFTVNTQRQQTVSVQREVARRLSTQVEDFMAQLRNDLRAVANVVPLAPQDEKVVQRTLDNVLQDEAAFLEIAVVGSNGREWAHVTRPGVPNPGLTDWSSTTEFSAAMHRATYLSPVYFTNGFATATLAVPITTQTGQVVGVMIARVDLTVLWDRVANAQIGQRGYAYVVDDHGSMVVYRDLRAPARVLHLQEVLDAITSGVESNTSSEYDTSLASMGEAALAYYKPIHVNDGTNWYVIVEQPTADAFAETNNFIIAGVGLLLASVLSIFLMGIYISRQVVNPISKLRRGATRLAQGDLAARISGVQTGDELEFLADEFNDMAVKLQGAQGNLAEVARERELQYQAAQRRVKEMSTLLQAGRAITSLDLESVLGNLARESAGAVGADRCSIFVLDERRWTLILRGWWDFEGVPQPMLDYEFGEGIVGWVARENKPLFLANAQADHRFVKKWSHDEEIAAVMNLPLMMDGAVVGALQVSTRPGTPAFSREDQRLLTSFADQSAAAIKNAQLYEVERRRAQEMSVVAEINRTISTSLDLETTLNAILASIHTLIPYDLAEINLWYEDEKVLRTRGRSASDPKYADDARVSGGVYHLDDGFTGWLARHRKPLFTADVSTSLVKSVLPSDQFPIQSAVGVPLLAGEQLVGTMELASLAPNAFTEAHLETLQTIAAQSAVAIQNAQLFAETRRRVDESAALFRLSTIAGSALAPNELLRSLMAEIGKLMHAELGLASLYNPDARYLEPLTMASFGDVPENVRDLRIDTLHPTFHRSVFATRLVFRSDDALNDRRILSVYRPFIERYQVRALITAPLIIRDQSIGEVYIAKRSGSPFTDEDQQRLGTVLTLLVDAIENARLTAERERRLKQLTFLSEIGRAISAALEPDKVIDALYEQMNRVIDARTLHVATYDETWDRLTFLRVYEDGALVDLGDNNTRRGENTLSFYVCRHRQALILRGDVLEEAKKLGIQSRTIGSTRVAKTWMGTPMISGVKVLGMISVQHLDDPFAFDQHDMNLLQSIANQTGVALVNAQLYAETQRRLNQLSLLGEIGRVLSAALQEDEVLNVLYAQTNRVMDAHTLFIAFYEQAHDEITFARIYENGALIDLPEADRKRTRENTLTFHVCRNRQALLLHGDINAEARQLGIEAKQVVSDRRAVVWMGVPMITGDRVLGAIVVQHFTNEAAYDENDLNLLQAIANQTGIAVSNARLYQMTDVSLGQRLEEVTALSAISQELNATLDRQRIFTVVLTEALKVTGATYGFISLINFETNRLEARAYQGYAPEQVKQLESEPVPVGSGITGRAVTTGEPVLVTDVRQNPDYVKLLEETLSEIAVPIRYAQTVVGVLNLESPRLNAFTPDHARFLEALASQAAIAIGNAQRLEDYRERGEQLRHKAEQLTNLFEIGQAFRTDQPLEQVLDDVVHAIQETVGFEVVVLNLVEGEPLILRTVAAAGVPIAMFEEMKRTRQAWSLFDRVLQDRFSLGQSYYVPMEMIYVTDGLQTFMASGADPSMPRTPGYWHPNDMLLTPLRGAAGRTLGLLSVDTPLGGRIPDRTMIETLELFANQAAIAIENSHLYADLQQRLDNLTQLNEVGRLFSAKLNLDSLLTTVLDASIKLVGSQHATIFLRDPNDGKFTPHTTIGFELSEISNLRFGPGEGLVGKVIEDRRAIIIPDVRNEPQFVEHPAVSKLRSALLVPLLVADQLIGVLSVDKAAPNGFSETDLVILSTLADQSAVAIDNARLFEAEREQRALAESLRDLAGALNSTLNFNEVVDQMLLFIERVVPHDAANIMLIDEAQAVAQVVRSRGYDHIAPGLEQAIQTLRFPVKDVSNLRTIVETGQPYIISDTRTYPGWVTTPETQWVRSYVCAPIRLRDSVVGFFNLDSATPSFFTQAHADRLMAFADQAAVAIENARLYGETQRRLKEQSLLYEAGQAISATLEYKQVLDTVTNQVVRATNAQIVIIQAWDRATDQLITVHMDYVTADGLNLSEIAAHAFAPTDYLKVAHFLRDRRSISLRSNDEELDPLLREHMQHAGLLWAIEVPIVARDEVLGLVRLGDGRFDRILTDSEVQLVETLVNQAAVAMSNARLYDQVVKFTQELEGRVIERTRELAHANTELTAERDRVEILYRITSELSASLDLDRVLNRALELVIGAVGAPHGSILLIDQQTDMLMLRAVLGKNRAVPGGGKPTPFRRGEGLAGWVIANRQAVIVPDVLSDTRWIEHTDQIREFRSALVAPLMVSEDVLGAMMVLHPESNYFTEVHMRLVTAATAQVATAINNAELYRYIREQAELLGGMLRAQQVESSKSQAILESVADGVMVTDANGRVILFNAAAESILGIRRDEAMGRSIEDMLGLYAAAGPQWISQLREWYASSEARRRWPVLSQQIEFKAERRYVNVSVAPVTMSDEYLGSVSVFRDITREVEADRAKTDFVSTVSHELRTPMTSIKGYADLMLLGAAGQVNETQQRFLSVIKANADRLSVLVNDLLDISRIESGRVKLDIKPVSIESIIEQVAASLRGKIEEKKLTLRLSLPEEELPRVYGDRDRVIQVLTNLVGNAYQYTPSGGSITVKAHQLDGFVQIDVIDTGIGIAPEYQAKVFDRFFRADDPLVQEFPGTGLGLAIVKSLVEMHEGRIWVESELGKGTTFSFILRVVEALPAVEPVMAPPLATSLPEPRLAREEHVNGRMRILVVEDDRDIAQLISHHLTESGYQVTVATRAKDALERARTENPDLITLDIYLPDADGFEVMQTLKTDPATARIPIVIVSVMLDQHEGFRLGAVDYLPKPIDPVRLVASVNRVLHGPGKVLVVDDDRDTRDLLQAALEQRGFSVVLTASGKRAIVLARQEEPDLILLDLRLPGMDGYEVLQRLKSSHDTADIPVMVITGSLTDEELKQQRVLQLGAARFMTKPFAVDELVGEIDALVGANLGVHVFTASR